MDEEYKKNVMWLKLIGYFLFCILIFLDLPEKYILYCSVSSGTDYYYWLNVLTESDLLNINWVVLIANIFIAVLALVEIGRFFSKNAQEFNETTHFLVDVREKSKFEVFILVIISWVYLFLTGYIVSEFNILFILPLAISHYFASILILNAWKFPLHKFSKLPFDRIQLSVMLIAGCFSLGNIVTQFLLKIGNSVYPINIFGFILTGILLIFILWQLLSFVNRFAQKYELALAEEFYSMAQEHEIYCSNCKTLLNDVMVHTLSVENYVFCLKCGNKIMSEEFQALPEEKLRKEHEKIIKKLNS